MKQMKTSLLILLLTVSTVFSQKLTGLSGWNIYLDPGHSMKENMGIFNYSEAEKNLRVALYLRDMLRNNTDIDTVWLCRYDDTENVGLSQRSDDANNKGAAWFHSIHSNAGGASANNSLLLWGQIRLNGAIQEKIPNGGKAMSDIMISILPKAMRIPSGGSKGDLEFYGSSSSTPYLSVNRRGVMPTELSEAGYHTNPFQNQRNMNAEYKKLEAQTLYWSILKYHNMPRPRVGICSGVITDAESGVALNGAKITIGGKSYVTDTYKSLFYKYSTDSTQLHNGFYYIEDLPNDSLTLTVEAPGYSPVSDKVSVIDTFFTFKDVSLISKVPPFVNTMSIPQNDSLYPGKDKLTISFSRPMNRTTVEAALTCTPPAKLSYEWTDDRNLVVSTDSLKHSTNYIMTLTSAALDKYDHPFDGNKDGQGGDSFTFTFKTEALDNLAPVIVSSDPASNATGIDLIPVFNIQFDEILNNTTISGKITLQKVSDQSAVNGLTKVYAVNDKTVINFYPGTALLPNEDYKFTIQAGIEDVYGNAVKSEKVFLFKTANYSYTVTKLDDFESGLTSNWYDPQQSGSTTGIVTELTSRLQNATILNPLTRSAASLQLNYGWDTKTTSGWLIREYLGAGNPRNITFNSSYIMQVYLFGDGNLNKFRFCVDDGADLSGHEVSPWTTVDWRGWKLVSWDMSKDGQGTWIGNGTLDGTLRFDSFQFTYTPGSPVSGTYYLDDFRLVKNSTVGVKEETSSLPKEYLLNQNYPNPFNPSTTISYQLPEKSFVSLKVYDLIGREVASLINSEQNAGYYKVNFNAGSFPSGIYIYQLKSDKYNSVRKMLLVK